MKRNGGNDSVQRRDDGDMIDKIQQFHPSFLLCPLSANDYVHRPIKQPTKRMTIPEPVNPAVVKCFSIYYTWDLETPRATTSWHD